MCVPNTSSSLITATPLAIFFKGGGVWGGTPSTSLISGSHHHLIVAHKSCMKRSPLKMEDRDVEFVSTQGEGFRLTSLCGLLSSVTRCLANYRGHIDSGRAQFPTASLLILKVQPLPRPSRQVCQLHFISTVLSKLMTSLKGSLQSKVCFLFNIPKCL